MATAEDYASWIVANKDKQGTPEFDTVAKAYQAARSASTAESAPVEKTPKPTDTLRQIALTGRAAFEGAFGNNPLIDLQMAPVRAVAKHFGVNVPDSSEMVKASLDAMGAYNPETAGERIASDTVKGAVGALQGGGALKSAATALAAGAAAGGASSGVREGGGNGLMQFLAGLAGGLAVPATVAGVTATGRTARNLIDPSLPGGKDRAAGRLMTELVGDKRPEIIAELKAATSPLPGLNLNAGQAAAKSGSAEFAALQKIVDEYKPTPANALKESQEGARRAAIQTIGKDKAALDSAVKERAANAKESYGAIEDKRIDERSLTEIMADAVRSRAESKASALQDKGRFDTFAAQQKVLGENFTPVPGMPRVSSRASNFPDRTIEGNSAAKEAGGIARERFKEEDFLRRTMDLLDNTIDDKSLTPLLRRPSMEVAVKDAIRGADESGGYFPRGGDQRFSIANLQRIKMSLDDMVRDPATFGIKATEAKEIAGTRQAFVKWLSNKSPEWKAARLQYAEDSVPINQMSVGQYLEKKLVAPLENKERAGVFAGAMEDAPRTIKNSTGQSMYDDLSKVLSPEQTKVANSVLANLKDDAAFNDLAKAGMPAARRITGEFAQPVQAVWMLNHVVTVANAIVKRIEGKATKQTMETLSDVLADPQRTAKILEAATPKEKKTIVDALVRATAAANATQ